MQPITPWVAIGLRGSKSTILSWKTDHKISWRALKIKFSTQLNYVLRSFSILFCCKDLSVWRLFSSFLCRCVFCCMFSMFSSWKENTLCHISLEPFLLRCMSWDVLQNHLNLTSAKVFFRTCQVRIFVTIGLYDQSVQLRIFSAETLSCFALKKLL